MVAQSAGVFCLEASAGFRLNIINIWQEAVRQSGVTYTRIRPKAGTDMRRATNWSAATADIREGRLWF